MKFGITQMICIAEAGSTLVISPENVTAKAQKNFFRSALCQGRVFLPVLLMGSYFPVDGRESCTKKALEKITLIFGIGLCPIS